MAAGPKELGQEATQIVNWLVDNREQFEQHGVGEEELAGAVGIAQPAAQTAIDQLENREVVVRDPEALTRPPRFVIKPGRSWPETRDNLLGARGAGGGK
jgi:hypothetical protein